MLAVDSEGHRGGVWEPRSCLRALKLGREVGVPDERANQAPTRVAVLVNTGIPYISFEKDSTTEKKKSFCPFSMASPLPRSTQEPPSSSTLPCLHSSCPFPNLCCISAVYLLHYSYFSNSMGSDKAGIVPRSLLPPPICSAHTKTSEYL